MNSVLGELLLNGLSFSPFRGCFGQVLFSPVFDCGFQNGAKVDALRGVLDRRLLRLLRINGFHLLNLCSSYSNSLSRMLFAPPGHYAPHYRILSLESAQFLLALSEENASCTFVSLLPPGLAALLRSAGFLSGAVFSPG